MRIAIDFDHTIYDTYNRRMMPGAKKAINKWYDNDHEVTIFTNRPDYERPVVETLLKEWGIKVHRVICGKPSYDLFIDDKAERFVSWE